MIDDYLHLSYRFTSRQRLLLTGLTALGFLLRLHRLAEQSIWFDESLSALFATQPLSIAVQSMLQEGLHHSPLFYILIRPFAVDGFTEFGVRFLPAVLGALAIPLIAQVGRVTGGQKVGLLGAVLLTISPFHVWYSQEARMYTLLTVSALGAMYFFVQNLRLARIRNWLAMVLFIVVGINSHHFAFFIPLVQFLYLIVTFKRNYGLLRPWVGAQLLAAMSLIPWLMIILDWGNFYLSSATRQSPTAYDLFQTLWNFSLGYTQQITLVVAIGLALFLGLLVLGLRSTYRTAGGVLLILWLLGPMLVTFFVSLRLPTYLDRYIILCLPPFVLLVASGLLSIRRQTMQAAVLLAVFLVSLVSLHRVYYDPTIYNRADWRSLGIFLEENSGVEDRIAVWEYQYLVPLTFYYDGGVALDPIISFDQVDLPVLPTKPAPSERLLVVIGHPNNSAHMVGHCQDFDIERLSSPIAARNWRVEIYERLTGVAEVPCIRVEIYE